MTSCNNTEANLASLPTELLLVILSPLPTNSLLPVASVSHRFHALVLRLLHQRLATAAGLDNHTLILECYHPSVKLFAGQLYCTSLGTDGLTDASSDSANCDTPVGKIARLGSVYTRFRPQHKPPGRVVSRRYRAGDIPGSRTHPSSASRQQQEVGDGGLVTDTVSLEAFEEFSQLCTVTNLVKIGPLRGLFVSIVEVGDGMIRVWRDWLAQQAAAGRANSSEIDQSSTVRAGLPDRADQPLNPTDDPSILWVNNSNNSVGIKFSVTERKWQRDTPVLFASEQEVAVSYQIHFEELLIKTSRLLLRLEQSHVMEQNQSGKAVVFGTFG
ncbi:hypothetical protein LTR66_009488 [Elasticomyces elasticus]|nr:hypothetical protein LTR66_009488 [Elasticomyces elasticus]